MSATVCSLVVPVHNGLAYLEPMVQSLHAHTDASRYELIFSDDASDSATLEFLRTIKGAVLHFSPVNRGFAAACNSGARLACGEFLVFLNTDLQFRPGWLDALLEAAQVATVGAVGGKLLYPDETIQHGGIFLREDRLDRIGIIASHDHVGKPSDDPQANRRTELLAVTAAAMLVRREAFEAIGGFDEGYSNGYEDVDLCLRLRETGWSVVYEPKCEIVHFESKSGAKRFAASKANQRRFRDRWEGRVRPEVLVTEHLLVGPHPDASPTVPFYSAPRPQRQDGVRIIVPSNGNTGALAATLEGIFAARVGLDDRVVAVSASDDDARYLQLCEGHDDGFSWTESLETAIAGEQPLVAWVEPGTIVTQGWLSRMLLHLSADVDAVGPLLLGVEGTQNVLSHIAAGSNGHFHPNELNHLFARERMNQGIASRTLASPCWIARRDDFPGVVGGSLSRFRIALDVFVHREARLIHSAESRSAA